MASQRKAGAVLGYVNIIVKNLVNLVYTPMLLAFVGQADYGVFQTSNSFVFSLSLLTFGFSQAYVRFYTLKRTRGTEEDIKSLNGMYLMLYIGVCAIALALGLLFAANVDVFFSGSFTPDQVELAGQLMAIMAFSVTCTLFSTVFDAYILAHEQFKFQQTRQMFTSLATPFVAFALLNLGMGAVGVALAQLAVYVTLLVLNARFAIMDLGMRFNLKKFDFGLFRAISVFSAWIFANQICDLINQSVPNIILGATAGATATAVFAVSVQIRNVFTSLSTTMSSLFTPEINRIVATSNDNAVLTSLMARVGRYQMILFAWVYGGFIVLGRFFIEKWAGPGFSEAYLFIVVMVAPLAISLTQNTGIEIQRAKNKHKARSVAYLIMAGINLASTAILSPVIGGWGAAIGYVLYIIFGCGLFMNWYYHARIGLDMFKFWRTVLPPLLCAAASTLACLAGTTALPLSSWVSFLLWGLAFTLLYGALLWTFVAKDEERNALRRRLGRFVGR